MNRNLQIVACNANRSAARSHGVSAPLREFCRTIAFDPRQVRTVFPHVAAVIDELSPS